ncbi:MAG: SDR family NAD(P)-dependent oxidoreductase [Solirubrobacterales bacterium]
MSYKGKVALVTGGANGLGRAAAARLIGQGANVVLADIEKETGEAAAAELGAEFIQTDVTVPEASVAAVDFTLEKFGKIDLAFLNAGIATGSGMIENFDLESYRRAMGVNLDGVVFGLNAVVPAMRKNGVGNIIATASLAGLAPTPFDPIYAANKHAVQALCRSMGPILIEDNITLNALCPGFAETRIVDPYKDHLEQGGIPLIKVEKVVDGIMELFEADFNGEAFFIQAGMDPQIFKFRRVPGPRAEAE